MPDDPRSERFRGNVLEFVPDDMGLGILGCIAAAFIVAGIIWAASRFWESIVA